MLRNNCRVCAIRNQSLCRALPDGALVQLNQIARRRTIKSGGRIFDNTSEHPIVANIVTGVARLSRSLADGRTQIVGLNFPTEFIGRPFAQDQELLIEAATEVELCYFSQKQFETLLLAYPELKSLFLQRTMEQLDQARDWMLLLGQKTAAERVASLLLLCAEKAQTGTCDSISPESTMNFELPLSRTDMASFLGLTIETVGRMIKRIESTSAIRVERGRGITILDREKLRRLVDCGAT